MEDNLRYARTEYVLSEITSHQRVVVSDLKDTYDLSDRIETQER